MGSRWPESPAVHCPCSHSAVLGAGYSSGMMPYLCPVSSKHVTQPGLSSLNCTDLDVCSVCVHQSFWPVNVWRTMADWCFLRNVYKVLSSLSPVVYAGYKFCVTSRFWEHNWINIFSVSLGPWDQGFLTFLLRSSLIKIPRLCKGSFNW